MRSSGSLQLEISWDHAHHILSASIRTVLTALATDGGRISRLRKPVPAGMCVTTSVHCPDSSTSALKSVDAVIISSVMPSRTSRVRREHGVRVYRREGREGLCEDRPQRQASARAGAPHRKGAVRVAAREAVAELHSEPRDDTAATTRLGVPASRRAVARRWATPSEVHTVTHSRRQQRELVHALRHIVVSQVPAGGGRRGAVGCVVV